MASIGIIGRQNVGKSTLFNALMRSRRNIVLDETGITRDIVKMTVETEQGPLELCDFPGFESPRNIGDDELTLAAVEHGMKRMADFQLLLWVVSRKGLSAFEENLAQELRRLNKPVWLVVNFVDDPQLEAEASDMYSLGFEKVFMVSALNGRNIRELREECATFFYRHGPATPEVAKPRVKLAIIGKPNAGKSTLFNWLLKKDIALTSPIAGTTRDRLEEVVPFQDRELLIMDTAGLRKKRQINSAVESYSVMRALDAVSEADVVLLVIDAGEGISHQVKTLLAKMQTDNIAVIVLLNKSDLLDEEKRAELERDIRELRESYWQFPYFFVSALDGRRMTAVLERAIQLHDKSSTVTSTSFLNQLLEKIKRNRAFLDQNIKPAYMIRRQPAREFLVFINRASVPEHIRTFLRKKIAEELDWRDLPIQVVFKKKN